MWNRYSKFYRNNRVIVDGMHNMTIYDRIQEAITQFQIENGKKPTGIYLGWNEMFELNKMMNDFFQPEVVRNDNLPPLAKCAGLRLFEVKEENHLKITGE